MEAGSAAAAHSARVEGVSPVYLGAEEMVEGVVEGVVAA